MSFASMHNVGAELLPFTGVDPSQFSGTTAVVGSAIATAGFLSCQVAISTGAVTGAPDSWTLIATIHDSADGSTDWQPYKPDAVTAATKTASAASTMYILDMDLQHSRGYIHVTLTPAFVAGTTPKVFGQAVVTLGGAHTIPTH